MDKREIQCKEWFDEYKDLTLNALEATESDTFIEILFKRDILIEKIAKEGIKEDIMVDPDELTYLEELEKKVLERLEEERKNIIQDIADLGDKKRAIRKYTPKFPFPPMPAFFDKKG